MSDEKCEMTAYTFCIGSMAAIEAIMRTNLYGIILWQMKIYLLNEKQEIHTIHSPWQSTR